MLITFYTDAYENITFFGDIAKKLLHYMGHSGTVPGALKAENIAEALNRLQSGLNQESSVSSPEKEVDEPPISLKHRAIPLIHLLEAANRKQCDVMWQ